MFCHVCGSISASLSSFIVCDCSSFIGFEGFATEIIVVIRKYREMINPIDHAIINVFH
jgi:hypothetical protein